MRPLGILGLAALLALVPSMAGAASSAPGQTITTTYVTVTPASASATTSSPGHAAAAAIDRSGLTYWQSLSGKADGVGQSITVHFASAVRVARVNVTGGAGPNVATFLSEARPKSVRISVPGLKPVVVTLKDDMSLQSLKVLAAKAATSIDLRVLSVYPSLTGSSVAISQLGFERQS